MFDSIKIALRKLPYGVYERCKKYRLERKSSKIIKSYVETHKVRKLQIGCGGIILNGWLNSDLQPYSETIAFLDASERFYMPDSSFDYIYSEHVFEHLTFFQQINYLRESYRILRPGGRIRIATPDFDFLIDLANKETRGLHSRYLEWNFNQFLKHEGKVFMDAENSYVYVVNNYFRDWGHQLIHNAGSLEKMISFCGFKIIDRPSVSVSTDPHLANLEHHGSQIGDEFNELETMILEAIK